MQIFVYICKTKRQNMPRCPHCKHEISFKQCSYYFLFDSTHSIKCKHCSRTIKPTKDPVNVNYCICAGFLAMVLPIDICLYIFHTSFIEGVFAGTICFIILELIIMFIVLKKIEFND